MYPCCDCLDTVCQCFCALIDRWIDFLLLLCSESNLKQLAALEISAGGRGLHQAPPTSSPAHSLGELYLSSPQGRQELVRGLTRGRVLPSDVPFHQHWTVLLPEMVSILTRLLYPVTQHEILYTA